MTEIFKLLEAKQFRDKCSNSPTVSLEIHFITSSSKFESFGRMDGYFISNWKAIRSLWVWSITDTLGGIILKNYVSLISMSMTSGNNNLHGEEERQFPTKFGLQFLCHPNKTWMYDFIFLTLPVVNLGMFCSLNTWYEQGNVIYEN